ncbi:hypothetical protein GQR58_018051 [Nymphon striatum]|nr:hypothetical protein GQR58_018051 [Nymphon striatum]
MSSSAQFLVAAGLLAVMLAIFSACVWGAASQITARADALISLRTTAGNFMAVVKVGQSFAKQNVQSEASAALSSSVLKGASPSIARADLQERFNAIAASAGVTISSVGNAPDRIRNELKQIGLTRTPKFNVDNTDGFQQPSTFSQTFARPIFSPTRRPYVEPVIEPEIPKPVEDIVVDMPEEVVPSEPIDVVVLGIQSTPTGSQALVRGNGSGEVVWVAVDESFDGWVLTDVSATSVRFTKGEQSQDVLMYSDDGQVGQ